MKVVLIAALGCLMAGCTPEAYRVGGKLVYHAEKNETRLVRASMPDFILPGKWDLLYYDRAMFRHMLQRPDSVVVSVGLAPKRYGGFAKRGMTNAEFVEAYYTWESDYILRHNIPVRKRVDSAAAGYIVWTMRAQAFNVTDSLSTTTHLFGGKGDFAYNLASPAVGWTQEDAQRFLVLLFRKN